MAPPTHADAVLVHGYWLSQIGDTGQVDLSLRSELAVRAASTLFKSGQVDYIVVTAGPIWGLRYESLGKRMSDELQIYGVPQDKIILQDTAIDTNDEITTFLQIAKQYNWTTLEDLAFTKQDLIIPTLYKNNGTQVSYLSVEKTLLADGVDEDTKAVNSLNQSWYEFNFAIYEDLIKTMMLVDRQYTFLHNQAVSQRIKKSGYGLPFLPVDKYSL